MTQATCVIENDINFTLIETGEQNYNESAGLNYSLNMTNGVGSGNINYGVIRSGILASGGEEVFDFQAISKEVFGVSANVSFTGIKGLIVENRSTVLGYDISIHATGSDALDEVFNGESGNLIIKPYAAHQYIDYLVGATVDASNKDFTISDIGGSGAEWTMVVVGVTG